MKKNLVVFFALSCLIVCVIYPLAWLGSLGRYMPAEYWLDPVYFVKKQSAREIDEKKVIVMSGSNSLFGINSQLLSERLEMPVVNMSGHAGLTFEFLQDQVMSVLEPGDIVIMPLEYEYYKREWALTEWQVANMSSWGDAHIKEYTFKEFFRYLQYSSLSGVISRYWSSIDKAVFPYSEGSVVASARKRLVDDDYSWNKYSYLSMNYLGDFLIERSANENLIQSKDNYAYLTGAMLTGYFSNSLLDFMDNVENLGAEVFLTWPVSIKNSSFDLDQREHLETVNRFKEKLVENGIEIYCAAEDFNLDVRYFFNTHYHLNLAGANIRTERLGQCISPLLN